MSPSVQLAQVYMAAVVAGGVLSLGSLLVGSFGRRPGEGFTPAGWVTALGSGLVLGGVAGLVGVVVFPSPAQRGSLAPALAAATLGVWVGLALQRRAARGHDGGASPPPSPVPEDSGDEGAVALPPPEP